MSFMDWIGKGQCAINIHDYSKWTYKYRSSCERERTCSRCDKVQIDISHESWSDYSYTQEDKCLQESLCLRCNEKQEKTVHVWSSYSYIQEDKCLQESLCLRCNEKQEKTVHVWGEEKRDDSPNPHPCKYVQDCIRCSERNKYNYSEYHHAWGTWEYVSPTSCEQIRFCRKCHESEDGEIIHKWKRPAKNYEGILEKTCEHCGEVEEVYTKG